MPNVPIGRIRTHREVRYLMAFAAMPEKRPKRRRGPKSYDAAGHSALATGWQRGEREGCEASCATGIGPLTVSAYRFGRARGCDMDVTRTQAEGRDRQPQYSRKG